MYENLTQEYIFQRMLANISDSIDKREGSVAWDMLSPKSIELAKTYIELDNILNFGFAETTYGEFLDLKVAEIGMTRLTAVKAKGQVTFQSATNGLIIPQGTVVYTDFGVRFLTDFGVTIAGGTATVNITAETGGNDGNVAAGAIINNEVAEATCFNSNSTTGGTDIENDEQLIARYLDSLRRPVANGNAASYRKWAMEVPGIGEAKVFPIWNGNGTVKVVPIGLDKKPISAGKVNEVKDYIETVRPIGANVTVVSATANTINVSATLTLTAGTTVPQVQTAIQDALNALFTSISYVDTDVKTSKVSLAILSVQGVVDISNLKLNGGTSNVTLTAEQVPVLGSVSLA